MYPSPNPVCEMYCGFSLTRRFGFVRFFDETEHRRALYEMQGAVGLGNKPIKVNAAVQKGYVLVPSVFFI